MSADVLVSTVNNSFVKCKHKHKYIFSLETELFEQAFPGRCMHKHAQRHRETFTLFDGQINKQKYIDKEIHIYVC